MFLFQRASLMFRPLQARCQRYRRLVFAFPCLRTMLYGRAVTASRTNKDIRAYQ